MVSLVAVRAGARTAREYRRQFSILDNDLGFLLIFIILPTALIVSGFWFLLLIRKDARLRELSQTNTPEPATADDVPSLEIADPEDDGLLIIATLPDPAPVESAPVDSDDEEFWTDTAELEFSPEDMMSTPRGETAGAGDSQQHSGFTEEIEPVDTAIDDESVSESDSRDENSVDQQDDDGDEDKRRRRQPGARLVPSGENVKKRAGALPRRPPPIPKSSTRDEDPV